MKSKTYKSIVIIGCLFLTIFVFFFVYKIFFDPYRGTLEETRESLPLETILTKKQAEKDLHFLVHKMNSRHPLWLEKNHPMQQKVADQLQKELESLSNEPTVLDVWKHSSRIAASIHDGHTSVYWKNPAQQLYIHDFSQLITYEKPIEINGEKIEDIYSRYLITLSHESSTHAEKQFFNSTIVSKDMLELCDVSTTNGLTMTFNTPEGIQTYPYSFVPIEIVRGNNEPAKSENWVSYTIDTEKSLGIFTLKTCDFNDEYCEILEAFFSEVFAQNITTITVDLRGNGGGNSWVANEFLKFIDIEKYASWDNAVRYGPLLLKNKRVTYTNNKKEHTFSGNIYVLTNVYSYSSAMNFAMLIQDNDLGHIVGEASGNSPASYGDVLLFQLPHSKINMTVSHKKWYRIDQTKDGSILSPDFPVTPNKALEKVYELIGF